MTIVCATHFTDSSFVAVHAAAALARVHHERLCLVSVVPGAPPTTGEHPIGDALRLEATALASAGVQTETAVLHGPLEASVRTFCQDKGAGLLIVGDSSHPRPALFGGPIDAFAHGIDLPLLVVRDAKPFDAWATGAAPLKVMLALDHTWSSSVARDWIRRLAEYGPIDLVAAFVWWPNDEYKRRGLEPADPQDANVTLGGVIRKELERALAEFPSNVKSRIHLEIGADHIAQTLMTMAGLEQVDLLVLGSHPVEGRLARARTVSQGVLMDAPMSVARIPSQLAATVSLVADHVRLVADQHAAP